MKIPNKIHNLNKIKKKINVPEYLYFSKKEFLNNEKKFLNKIRSHFSDLVIVRSAANDEDTKISNAGKYESISNIKASNVNELKNSIEKVSSKLNIEKDFIIIQKFINKPKISGVIFTCDINNSAPFVTINFSTLKKTDLITSGKISGAIVTYFNKFKIKKKNFIFRLNNQITKISKIFNSNKLDIEFAIKNNKIYIFQVRGLNTASDYFDINYESYLNFLSKKISKLQNEKLFLSKSKRYFSTMTDWNPAEIIGLKPKILASSLYETLITDEVWNISRTQMGYKKNNSTPLMHNFYGTNFIDLRVDFESFLLDKIPLKQQLKIINFYNKEFSKKPYYYFDKVESELIINCCTLSNYKNFRILKKAKISNKNIKNILKLYTRNTEFIISKIDENIKKYIEGDKILKKLKKERLHPINKIFQLVQICKNFGTLPFANLARMAFIGIEFLNSMVEKKIITTSEYENFMSNTKTISSEMQIFLKSKNKKKFLNKYGHIRPDTYEINSKNYKENFNNYFDKKDYKKSNILNKKIKFNFSVKQKKQINYLLKKNNFSQINCEDLINFIKRSIYEREKSKLHFSKFIDEIFNQINKLFNKINLNKKYATHTNINHILRYYNHFSGSTLKNEILKQNKKNIDKYNFNLNFNLPNVIINPRDIYYFKETNSSPTFVGSKTVMGKLVYVNNKKQNLNNKIICIENADPGYDYIFSKNIKGLITAYGGPNSHMTIRCSEFNLPAIIGLGQKKLDYLMNSKKVMLDCKKKIITRL